MDIDLPDVVAEVRAAFDRYEKALVSNDVAVLDELFRDDPRTIRYGAGEILYGSFGNKIVSVRRARRLRSAGNCRAPSSQRSAANLRWLRRSTSGHPRPEKLAVRLQTWVKFPEGWRVVAAHVSLMEKSV